MAHVPETSAKPHKSPNYLLVGGILLVLTIIEIAVASIPGFTAVRPVLFVLMLAKVVLVAMFYMHLRSDSKWFAAFFLAPIPFILLMVAAMMIRTCPAALCK